MGKKLLSLSPIVGYLVAHVLVVGFWGYWRSKYGADAMGRAEADLSGTFWLTFIPTVPPALVLGLFDAAARVIGYPLLNALDALLLVLLALVWIVPIESVFLDMRVELAGSSDVELPSEQVYLGVLAGAELSLVLLLLVSVSTRLIAGLILRRQSRYER
jgi:hypothetical protein